MYSKLGVRYNLNCGHCTELNIFVFICTSVYCPASLGVYMSCLSCDWPGCLD